MKTKSESALEFIKQMISAGKTVYLTTYGNHTTKITPNTFNKWAKSGHDLFKINSNGDLLISRGKSYDCIVTKHISFVNISAA